MTLIAPIRKAVVAAVMAFVVAWVARRGWTLDAETTDTISAAVGALVTGALTWAVRNVPALDVED